MDPLLLSAEPEKAPQTVVFIDFLEPVCTGPQRSDVQNGESRDGSPLGTRGTPGGIHADAAPGAGEGGASDIHREGPHALFSPHFNLCKRETA